jgi:hypothetical protein
LHHVLLLSFIKFLINIALHGVFLMPFFLLICKVYTRRENAGSWISGPEKATAKIPILHISKWAEIPRGIILEYIRNTGPENNRRRATRCPHSTWAPPLGRALVLCEAPGPPPTLSFCYISHFTLKLLWGDFQDEAPPPRGGTRAGAIWLSGGQIPSGTLSSGGESKPSSSPTTLSSWEDQSSSSSTIAPSHLNP